MRSWFAFIPVLLLATGCDLYFGSGDDTVCNGDGYEVYPSPQYRDPDTATCIDTGWGHCDGCSPCTVGGGAKDIGSDPDMGLCQSACTGLSEVSCEATAGCYASFQDDPAADGKRTFTGCWQTAPSGPVGGSCSGLTAHECSRHDNCELVYTYTYNEAQVTTFLECVNETHYQGCAAADCAPGYHCEDQCYPADDGTGMGYCEAACVPDNNSCASTTCDPGYVCIESCEGTGNGSLQCGPQCVPDPMDPGSCTGAVACDANPPACPSGTTPGIRNGCWTGYCIPNSACGPGNPGECYGALTCLAAGPACPAGTTPGIANGCYTGYCIPEGSCPLAACETLSSESACSARGDCQPVYIGMNCTCYPYGCTCETETYDRCETVGLAL